MRTLVTGPQQIHMLFINRWLEKKSMSASTPKPRYAAEVICGSNLCIVQSRFGLTSVISKIFMDNQHN